MTVTYVKTVKIENIRSIRNLKWELPDRGSAPGWHVILGTNGSGKSTFLKALTLALIGDRQAIALRMNANAWLAYGTEEGSTKISLTRKKQQRHLHFFVVQAHGLTQWSFPPANGQILEQFPGFVSAFGPYRRFGSDRKSPPPELHASLFDDTVTFADSLEWLQQLKFKQLEDRPDGRLLDSIRRFINQDGFLPHGIRLHEISSDGVTFQDANDALVPISELSDGFRSVLCLTIELLRQLAMLPLQDLFTSGPNSEVSASGVVLIDEIDVHLHPQWQREIGLWFRKHFPNIQFFVTTHSPLVCQAAEVGTVFALPDPGSDEEGRMIAGAELDRLLYGNVLEAYGTSAFDVPVTRSEAGQNKLARLAELNVKETDKGLTKKEMAEQETLRAAFPTAAHARANGDSHS